jgi:WD40 repeat protein/tRNA A-37 threonylcarbamoyl transferase component Bud32
MRPDEAPAPLEQELAARLAALDEERARAGGAVGAGDPTAGLPPEAAARLRGAIEGLTRLMIRWPWPAGAGAPPQFGKFVIERELGRGGHGIVFLATDPALKRQVALKIPRPELLDEPDWRRRFLREAHAVARLDHPGIAAVLEVGEVDGVCYIASAYSKGPNLADWLRGPRTLDPRAAARVAGLIAEAVGHAHAHGVVHRDLKPRNILMQPLERPAESHNPDVRPRVTDFGLAKLIEAEGELTRTGAVLGTPRYMAPEQRQARHDLIGPPTDVYAIGTILDEMLSGRRDVAGGPPAGQADVEESSDGAPCSQWHHPRALRAIIEKCLEPEPARRYADASDLAADLNRFLSGGRVRAARLSPGSILGGAGRHPVVVVAAAAAACSVALLLVFNRGPLERHGSPPVLAPASSSAPRVAGTIEQERRYVADLRLVDELAPKDLGSSTYKLAMARAMLDRYRLPAPESHLRTWEWSYFQLMLHGERATIGGHRSAIYHLEYSRDGTRLTSSGEDGVRVWTAATGALERQLGEHSGCVNWVGFSPDGTKLATAGDDRTVRVWSANDGRRLLPPLAHSHNVVVVLFSPDGGRLVAADRSGTVTTWDSRTGAMVRSDKVSGEPIEGMDLAPDGSTLAVSATHEVTLWDYPAMRRRTFPVPTDSRFPPIFECVAFSHDGRRLATAGGSAQQIRVWDTQTGQLSHAFVHHADERVLTVAFSWDDRLLLSTSSDEAARVWDLRKAECAGVLAGHGAWVWCGGFAPDGKFAATADRDGAIKLWGIPHRGTHIRTERPSMWGLAMAFNRDGTSLDVATREGSLVAADPATGRELGILPLRSVQPLVDAAFAPGADRVAVADIEGTLSVGSRLKEQPDFTLQKAAASRACLTFSRDGQRLAYVGSDGAVVELDATGRVPRPRPLGSPPSSPTVLAFARDGRLLGGDAEGGLFALAGHARPAAGSVETGHRGRITALAVSPDGSLCATGGEDASIILWDARALRIHARLARQEQAIDALAFTPDGRALVSLAERVQLWNVATARPTIELTVFLGRQHWPGRLAISADGTTIAVLAERGGNIYSLSWRGARIGPEAEPAAR